MKPIRNIMSNASGYLWMIASITVAAMLFSSIGIWEKRFVAVTGIQVSPKYTGGEVISVVDHKTYQTSIHRPVFDGQFGLDKRGFVQIDWRKNGNKTIPAFIEESFDYDIDGKNDFTITLDTVVNTARLKTDNPRVLAILDRSSMSELTMKGYPDARFGVFTFKDGRSVRVLLEKD